MNIIYSINTTAKYGIGYIADMAVKCLRRRKHHVLRVLPEPYITDELFDVHMMKEIARTRTKTKIDLLHVWANMGLEQMKYAKNHDIPVILDRASTHITHQAAVLMKEHRRKYVIPPPTVQRQLEEYDIADKIIVPSGHAFETFPEEMKQHGHILRIIPFGVDCETFKPDPTIQEVRDEQSGFRALFVGSNLARKGYKYFIKAIERISPPIDYWTVGTTGIGLGHVTHHKMPRLYNLCDVFVLPSLEEGCSLAVMEAMACGIPVVVTEACGLLPGFRNHQHGIIVPERDPDAIADAINHIRFNESDARYMGKNARKLTKKFTWDRYTDELCEVYKEVIENA